MAHLSKLRTQRSSLLFINLTFKQHVPGESVRWNSNSSFSFLVKTELSDGPAAIYQVVAYRFELYNSVFSAHLSRFPSSASAYQRPSFRCRDNRKRGAKKKKKNSSLFPLIVFDRRNKGNVIISGFTPFFSFGQLKSTVSFMRPHISNWFPTSVHFTLLQFLYYLAATHLQRYTIPFQPKVSIESN